MKDTINSLSDFQRAVLGQLARPPGTKLSNLDLVRTQDELQRHEAYVGISGLKEAGFITCELQLFPKYGTLNLYEITQEGLLALNHS